MCELFTEVALPQVGAVFEVVLHVKGSETLNTNATLLVSWKRLTLL